MGAFLAHRPRRPRAALLRARELGSAARIVDSASRFPPTRRCSRHASRARLRSASTTRQPTRRASRTRSTTIMPTRGPTLRNCIVMAVRTRAGDVAGAMVVANTDAGRFSSAESQLLADIAAQAGIVLDIARLFRAAEVEIEARRRAEEVQRFYAETSAVLSLSLDYPESFEQLARLCVPFLADLCLIDVAEEHGVRRLAAVHADPAKAALVAELETEYPPDPYGRIRRRASCAAASPRSPTTMSDELPAQHDPRRAPLRDREGARVHVVHVRAARGARPRPRRAHARVVRIGPALRRGRPRARRRVRAPRRRSRSTTRACTPNAITSRARCSRACCRRRFPTFPARRVTARYRAAGEGNEVGGDFYHVFQVDEHAWWFAIGDVSGKGPEAAAIAGLARHTLRALALARTFAEPVAHDAARDVARRRRPR